MFIDKKSSANIERLYELTRHGDTALAAFYDDEMADWLEQFIERELPGSRPLVVATPERFVETIRALDENRRRWSRVYGDLVLDMNEDAAGFEAQRLRDFIADCPWKFLRESAMAAEQELDEGRNADG